MAPSSGNQAQLAKYLSAIKAVFATRLTKNKAGLYFGLEARHRPCAPFTVVFSLKIKAIMS